MLSHKANRNTQHKTPHKVNVKIVETQQKTHVWQCRRCGQTLHTSLYSKWLETHTTQNTKMVCCNRCITGEEQNRAETHMWQCKRCSQTLHKAFYSKWLETHTTQNTNLVRCDRCIAVEGQQQQTRTSQNVCYGHGARYNQQKIHSQRQTILQQ